MNRYKLRKVNYLVYVFTIIVALIGIFIIDKLLNNDLICIVYKLGIFASLILTFFDLFKYIELNEQSIIYSTLYKKSEIPIKKIERIVLMPTTKGKKVFIGVYNRKEKIFITFWYKDYTKLLADLVSKCDEIGSAKIERSVRSLIVEKF